MSSRTPHAWTLTVFSVLCSSAQSAEFNYTVGVGVERNDNVNLSETAPVGDTILEPALGFTFNQSGSTIQAAADGFFEYRDYLQGHYSDDFLGQLNGQLNWAVVPERLNFGVEDYLGVQPINNLSPDTPGNQQQINVLAVGPTLNFRIGPTVRGQAELRYINSYAEETDQFNSDRASAAVRAIKDLSSTSTLSANLVDERVSFRETDVGPDYSRYSAFGRYTRNWAKLDLIADFGYSWINYSGSALGVEDRDDPLARANLNWHVSQRSTLSVNLAHQLSDAASGLLGSTIGSEVGGAIPAHIATGSATTTSEAYLENRIDFAYAYLGVRGAFTVAPYYRKLDYGAIGNIGSVGDGAAINQSARGAVATASWRLQPLLTVGLVASGENLRYDQIAREDKTWSVQAFLRKQWTRHWSWRAELTRYQRDSSVAGQSADQNIVFFGVTYTR